MHETVPSALPAPPEEMKPTPWYLRASDMLLAAMALALAFLLASYAVRNADFWQHLAAGRLLAAGQYAFGADPFGYGQPDKYWTNHAWGFDAGIYQIHQRLGDKALVMAKALFVAALAGLVLLSRPSRERLFLPAVCAVLAVLIAGPRLAMQPVLASMGGVAPTMLLLLRVEPRRWVYFFPPLFAVWANLDIWFFLGPAMLALYFLGDLVKGAGKASGRALAVGILACMVGPHHYHVWQLPAELTSEQLRDPFLGLREFNGVFNGLFDDGMLSLTLATGLVPQTLAFFVLFFLTILGFATNLKRLHPGHALIVVLLLAVSFRYARALPFLGFAMAPLAAHYLSLTAARLRRADLAAHVGKSLRNMRVGGRLIALLLLAGLLFAAWPGWLHPFWEHPILVRRVAWDVEPDPGLAQAAATLKEWREAGKLPPEAHGLTFGPDFASYCAWFAPGERQFVDFRFTHNQDLIEELAAARRSLVKSGRPEDAIPQPDFNAADFLRKHRIAFLAWTAEPRLENMRGLKQLLSAKAGKPKGAGDPVEGQPLWEYWHSDGRISFLGWNPQQAMPAEKFAALKYDALREAYGSSANLPPTEEGKESTGPATFWEAYFQNPQKASTEIDKTAATLEYRVFLGEQARNRAVVAYVIEASLAPGMAGEILKLNGPTIRIQPEMLATSLIAVRSARRAIAGNPDLPEGYYYLSRAYDVNDGGFETADLFRNWMTPTGFQMGLARIATLEQAGRRPFNLFSAAERLYHWHLEHQEFELAQRDYEMMVQFLPINLGNRISEKDLQEAFERLKKELVWRGGDGKSVTPAEFMGKLRDEYENYASRFTEPLPRAVIASQRQQNQPYFGLVYEALDEFAKVDWQKAEPRQRIVGMLMQTDLFFRTGQVERAGQILAGFQTSEELMKDTNFLVREFLPRYIRVEFALGAFGRAIEAKKDLLRQQIALESSMMLPLKIMPNEAWQIFFRLTDQPEGSFPRLLRGPYYQAAIAQQNLLSYEADSFAQLGFMYLEAGDNAEARKMFEQSLNPRPGISPPFQNRSLVRTYLDGMNAVK